MCSHSLTKVPTLGLKDCETTINQSRLVRHTAGHVNEISERVSCQVKGGVQRALYQTLQRRNTNSICAIFEAVGKRIRQAKGKDSVQIYARIDASSVLPNFHGNILCVLQDCMVA